MNLKSILFVLSAWWILSFPAFAQIQKGQSIRVTLSGVPAEERAQVDGDYPVGENGSINMPNIGVVSASGLRPEQLAIVIQNRYKNAGIYKNPTIQVFANTQQGVVDEQVFVGGQVRRTGQVKFTRGLTLYQAVQAAGGATEFGSMKRVKLLREGKQISYDLTQLESMKIQLHPNDTIEVPQKGIFGN